jgi:sugar phosphate isomerase/epimerase
MTVLGTTYRLGSTSYVWPADLLPNVRRLGPWVDDVELVLFEVEDASNLPDAETVAELKALAGKHDLTYTIHMPLDLALAHPQSLQKARMVVDGCHELSPWAYVLHLDGRDVEGEPDAATLAQWRAGARDALEELVGLAGDPALLCVENLENYQPDAFLPLLADMGVSLCVDVGHLWLAGCEPVQFLTRNMAHTRVVHMHGIGERDHQSLARQGAALVTPVLEFLAKQGYDGVLTLEVFSRADFFSSRELVKGIVNGRC